MSNKEVLFIPAKETRKESLVNKPLKVAAYCRVSTGSEEQLTSFNSQKEYYMEKIMHSNKWSFAGIYADEGLSGVSTKKRDQFNKMISDCKKGKIDIILTKSVSRFSRNTLDCIKYTRLLKSLEIGVIFEKENINTLESDSEFMITLLGSLAQSESENISKNVAWGKRQAMKQGRVDFRLYGYEKNENGDNQINEGQAKVIRKIFSLYLDGYSEQKICNILTDMKIDTYKGGAEWKKSSVAGILKNEKYCGDYLAQKTFVSDMITKKAIRNDGQLPQYYIKDNHIGIISREIYEKASSEREKRSNEKSATKGQKNTFSRYSGKYALTHKIICGECGSYYFRNIRTKKNGDKKSVWRCSSRRKQGSKYCKNSPTLDEKDLHRIILKEIFEKVDKEIWSNDEYNARTVISKEKGDEFKSRLVNLVDIYDVDEFYSKLTEVESLIYDEKVSLVEINKVNDYPVWIESLVRRVVGEVVVNKFNVVISIDSH